MYTSTRIFFCIIFLMSSHHCKTMDNKFPLQKPIYPTKYHWNPVSNGYLIFEGPKIKKNNSISFSCINYCSLEGDIFEYRAATTLVVSRILTKDPQTHTLTSTYYSEEYGPVLKRTLKKCPKRKRTNDEYKDPTPLKKRCLEE